MADVIATPLFAFPATPAVDLKALVKGPDGAPFVLDAATKTVYRIDLASRKATAIFRAGAKPPSGGTESTPVLIGVGGRDLLMVDDKNVVWRWRLRTRPAGHVTRGPSISGSTEWSADVPAIGDPGLEQNLYNLYVVDPSQRRSFDIARGRWRRLPDTPNQWLTAARDVSGIPRCTSTATSGWPTGARSLRLVSSSSAGGRPRRRRLDRCARLVPNHRVCRRRRRGDLRL
jgi:hypothetical protein